MSEFYKKTCSWVNERIGPNEDEIEKKREKDRQAYLEQKDDLIKIEQELRDAKIVNGKDSKKYLKIKNRYQKKKKKKEKCEEKYKKEDFKKTMKFIGMDFEYEEVLTFSIFLGTLGFIFALIALVVSIQFFGLSIFEILIYGIPALTIIPSIIITVTAYYPDLLEKRLKADCIGEIPETINLMTMSMRINPSLHRALTFAANNSEEPISSGLKKISWDVYMKEKISLEESFLDFAVKWGMWNKNLKSALYSVRSAMLEKEEEGFNKALERANETVIEGTKQQVKRFSKSLQTPTTVLFAIGVILPMIVGAMLPMTAMGGIDIGSMTTGTTEQRSGMSLTSMVILMNLVFPLGAFLYSYHILGKRPGTQRPVKIKKKRNRRKNMLISAMILVAIALSISLFHNSMDLLMPVPLLLLIAVPTSYYCLTDSYHVKKERERISKLEKQFPDALFQLGSRIAEGTSLEKALVQTSDSLKQTDIGGFFDQISSSLLVNRSSIEDTLFGDEGVLKDHPSNTIKTTMRTVVQISKKDPEEAGRIIMKMANYKRDLQDMDKELKNMLSKNVEMMKGTAVIFAPFTMGVISSLYFMLEEVFTNLGGVELISPVAFSTVLGIYVILMGTVITYFTKGIENSLDSVEFKYALGKTVLFSTSVYSISLIIGRSLINII